MAATRSQRRQLAVARVGGKLHRLPARRHALLVGQDPDLEQLGLGVLLVVLGVLDAVARAHHLDLARLGAALVAKMVLMRDRASYDVGHDLHVAVGMRREARVGRDAVVVPHAQRAPMHALGVAIFGEAEMEVGVEPAVVGLAQLVERSEFDHGITSCRQNGAAASGIKFPIGNGSIGGPDASSEHRARAGRAGMRNWLRRSLLALRERD